MATCTTYGTESIQNHVNSSTFLEGEATPRCPDDAGGCGTPDFPPAGSFKRL